MTICVDATCASISRTLPLCCRYFAVLLQSLPVQARDWSQAGVHGVHWALGVFEDGQHEVMGVWPEPVSGASAWQAIHGDLAARGVERIRFVVSPEPANPNAMYPGTTVLGSVAPLLAVVGRRALARDGSTAVGAIAVTCRPGDGLAAATAVQRPPVALSPRLRQVMAGADEAARHLQAGLRRALTRHGCFDSHESAVSFIEHALQRLARGLVATPPASAGVLARQLAGAAAARGMRATSA